MPAHTIAYWPTSLAPLGPQHRPMRESTTFGHVSSTLPAVMQATRTKTKNVRIIGISMMKTNRLTTATATITTPLTAVA